MARTNPHGANQVVVDPRQHLFLENYFNPKSETFSNSRASALKAGYEKRYAENIISLMPEWLSIFIEQSGMLVKAERNLNNMLDMGEDTEGKLRVKADISKFIAERLGKRKYAERTESVVVKVPITGMIILDEYRVRNKKQEADNRK